MVFRAWWPGIAKWLIPVANLAEAGPCARPLADGSELAADATVSVLRTGQCRCFVEQALSILDELLLMSGCAAVEDCLYLVHQGITLGGQVLDLLFHAQIRRVVGLDAGR